MSIWWDSISVLEQFFIIIALPATIILFIQTIMLIFGMGHGASDTDLPSDISGMDHADFDAGGADSVFSGFEGAEDAADAHGLEGHYVGDGHDAHDPNNVQDAASGLRIFSIRGIIAFLVVAGWSGALMLELGMNPVLTILLSALFGFIALVAIAKMFASVVKLQESGTVNYNSAIGHTGEVYIRVPAAGKGGGKVTVTVSNRLSEFEAVTHGEESLPTGTMVRVVDVVRGNILVVESMD